MPELDGLEATRCIRARSDLAQPRIVALTANAMDEDRVRCLEAGMDEFVTKPVKFVAIERCLQTCIASAGGTAPLA